MPLNVSEKVLLDKHLKSSNDHSQTNLQTTAKKLILQKDEHKVKQGGFLESQRVKLDNFDTIVSPRTNKLFIRIKPD